MKNKIIETTSADREEFGHRYALPGGGTVQIGNLDSDFFEKLQSLPASTKIEMMQLTAVEMEQYIADQKQSLVASAMILMKKKWYFRETGDPAIIEDDAIHGVPFVTAQIIGKLKRKPCTLSQDQLLSIINFYAGDRSDVYFEETDAPTLPFPT